jgi:hypothetical protein
LRPDKAATGQGLAGQSALTGETINVPDAAPMRASPQRRCLPTLNMLSSPSGVATAERSASSSAEQTERRPNGATNAVEQIAETVGPVLEHIPSTIDDGQAEQADRPRQPRRPTEKDCGCALDLILDVTRRSCPSTDARLRDMATVTTITLDADRATIFIVDRDGEIWSRVARDQRNSAGHRRGIAGLVAATGETINIPDIRRSL